MGAHQGQGHYAHDGDIDAFVGLLQVLVAVLIRFGQEGLGQIEADTNRFQRAGEGHHAANQQFQVNFQEAAFSFDEAYFTGNVFYRFSIGIGAGDSKGEVMPVTAFVDVQHKLFNGILNFRCFCHLIEHFGDSFYGRLLRLDFLFLRSHLCRRLCLLAGGKTENGRCSNGCE